MLFTLSRHSLALPVALLLVLVQGATSYAAPRTNWTPTRFDPPIQGNAPIAAWSRGDVRCFDYPKYTVSESSERNTTNNGAARFSTTIAVRAASTRCKQINPKNQNKTTFVINNSFEFFQGLVNNVLITDSGSGPDGRVLKLYDIEKQSEFLQFTDYSDTDMTLRRNELIFWRKTGPASKQNCRQYNEWSAQGLGAVIETQVIVDFATRRARETTQRRCQPRQSRGPQ